MTQLPRVQVLLAIRILVEFRSAVFGRFLDLAILDGEFPAILCDFQWTVRWGEGLEDSIFSGLEGCAVWPGPGTTRTQEEKAERNSAGHCAGYSGEL